MAQSAKIWRTALSCAPQIPVDAEFKFSNRPQARPRQAGGEPIPARNLVANRCPIDAKQIARTSSAAHVGIMSRDRLRDPVLKGQYQPGFWTAQACCVARRWSRLGLRGDG